MELNSQLTLAGKAQADTNVVGLQVVLFSSNSSRKKLQKIFVW